MTITFFKHRRFVPNDVKDVDYDINDIWHVEKLSFKGFNNNHGYDTTEYELAIVHKPTGKRTNAIIGITLHDAPQYNNYRTEIHMRRLEDTYYRGQCSLKERQRNIFILLEKCVKNIEFIKNIYNMRHIPQRQVMKEFGKIFEKERW